MIYTVLSQDWDLQIWCLMQVWSSNARRRICWTTFAKLLWISSSSGLGFLYIITCFACNFNYFMTVLFKFANSTNGTKMKGEKECSYYVWTGRCKFGLTCKFHHPEPAGALVPSPAPTFYPTVQAPTMASWQVARPAVLPAPYMQPPYDSMVLSPTVVSVPGWSLYAVSTIPNSSSVRNFRICGFLKQCCLPLSQPTVNPALSPGGQHSVQAGSLFDSSNQLSPSAPAFPGPYTSISSAGPSSSTQREQAFPQRPGQPDCHYFMRTGDCKFGPKCKYHHPPEWRMPRIDCVLSPVGLPLRPVCCFSKYYFH